MFTTLLKTLLVSKYAAKVGFRARVYFHRCDASARAAEPANETEGIR